MHALITRPLEDAKPLAELLAARGVDCVIEPLLEIVPKSDAGTDPGVDPDMDLRGVQALLFTSANGARAFAAKSARRDIKVLTVGDGSAAAAREAGFRDVTAAEGDVDTLTALAVQKLDPKAGPLFHGAGSALAGDLQGKLEQAGFTLRRSVLYEAKTATAFSPETRMNLALGGIDMVLLFSPRTARTFASLWDGAGKPNLSKTAALCLSPAVAREIAALGWQRMDIAERPEQSSMLRLVETEIARRAPVVAESRTAEPMPREQVKADAPPTRAPIAITAEDVRRSGGRGAGGILGGILGGLIAGALAGGAVVLAAPYWQPLIGVQMPATVRQNAPDLAPIQAKLDALTAGSAHAVTQDKLDTAMGGIAGKLDRQTAQLADRLAKLERDAAASPGVSASPDLQGLKDSVAELEARLAQIATADAAPAPDFSGDVAAMKSADDALTQQLKAARDQIAALQSKQAALDGTVAEIASHPTVTAAQQRGTVLVLALSELRGALAVSEPYAPKLRAIDALIGDDADLKARLTPALDPLRGLDESGAPTLARLQASLPATEIAEAANSEAAANAVGAGEGWSERLINRLSEAVTIRPVGAGAQGDGPLPRLARGEAKLNAGDLAGSVSELDGLRGKAAAAARTWLDRAKARLAQDQAAARIDQASATLLAPNTAE